MTRVKTGNEKKVTLKLKTENQEILGESVDQLIKHVEWVLNSDISNYRIGLDAKLNQQLIARYRRGDYDIDNARFNTIVALDQVFHQYHK